MWNTVALVIAIILCLCVIAGVAYIINRSLLLDDWEEELKKYSTDLDERANRISQEEEDLRVREREFRGLDIYMASYTETEADTMKYTTDALIESHARKHIAMTIAQDLLREYKPMEDTTADGRRRFSYKFKIKEEK